MNHFHDLKKMIAERNVLLVIGSGVSLETTAQAPTWRQLIESALNHCNHLRSVRPFFSECVTKLLSVLDRRDDDIRADETAEILTTAAEMVTHRLRCGGDAEYGRWLEDTFSHLKPQRPQLLNALAALNLPMMTTNFDGLISDVTQRRWITWKDDHLFSRWLRSEHPYVLHFHGHWERPDSIVLGIRTYEQIRNHEFAQTALRSQAMQRSLLLVGCGPSGLSDPNFSAFFQWLKRIELQSGVRHRHYWLMIDEYANVTGPVGRLFALGYGRSHDCLTSFIEALHPGASVISDEIRSPKNVEVNNSIETGVTRGIACESRQSDDCGAVPLSIGERDDSSKVGVNSSPLARSVHEYLRRLAAQTESLSLMDVGRDFQVELATSDVFVPLRANLRRSFEGSSEIVVPSTEQSSEYQYSVDLLRAPN